MNRNRHFFFIALLQIIAILFVSFGVFGSTVCAAQVSGRVLFISSYSYAWDTVQQQILGLSEALGPDVVMDYEFMDTKRVDDETALQLFHDGLKYRMENVEPYDVVILGDDAALQFAMEYQEELFDGIPMVFEGVNDVALAQEAASDEMVTGIIEKIPMDRNIRLGQQVTPGAKKVVAVLDDTITGEAERQYFYSFAEEFPELEFGEINCSVLTNSELRQAIRDVQKDTILIYMVMTEDASGRQYTNAESLAMLSEISKVPVIRVVEGGIGEGGVLGGYVISFREIGRMAGSMANGIIGGRDVASFDVVAESPGSYCLDVNVLKKFDIPLDSMPEDAVLVNQRHSFLSRYKEVLFPGVIVILAMAAVIVAVLVDNLRHRKLLRQLEDSRKLIETASQHDFLTGIANRSKFMSDLTELIEQEIPCTVVMIDIDDFKHINDTMGHTAGDEALQQVAARLREMESQILTPYRYAGDEFILVVRSTQRKILEKTAYQCRQVFTKPFVLNGAKAKICGSIGIASYPEDTKDLEELIICADDAMYHVKKNGKNDFAFYTKKTEEG